MIQKDINKRWEEGVPHHFKSEQIVKALALLDWQYGNDTLCIKTGGDGDNGEHMMYLLDIYFETKDRQSPQCKTCGLIQNKFINCDGCGMPIGFY
jgi:hypothetical protein